MKTKFILASLALLISIPAMAADDNITCQFKGAKGTKTIYTFSHNTFGDDGKPTSLVQTSYSVKDKKDTAEVGARPIWRFSENSLGGMLLVATKRTDGLRIGTAKSGTPIGNEIIVDASLVKDKGTAVKGTCSIATAEEEFEDAGL